MSEGFWRFLIPVTTTIPRSSDFSKFDALNENLWPHGANLLSGAFDKGAGEFAHSPHGFSHEMRSLPDGSEVLAPVLSNENENATSSFRVSLRLTSGSHGALLPGDPYLFAVLASASKLSPSSRYYCRVYFDEEGSFDVEAFNSGAMAKRSALQVNGFVRLGHYPVVVPASLKKEVIFEFGLRGVGQVFFHDPVLMNVSAVEQAYWGRLSLDESSDLPGKYPVPSGVARRPTDLFSWQGLSYAFTGLFPVNYWLQPALVWGTLALLVLAATFALASLMRHQWIDGERYPLPLLQIPLLLLGRPGDRGGLQGVHRDTRFLAGFGLAALWCLMRGWRAFNSDVPNLNIALPLDIFAHDYALQRMLDGVVFSVSGIFFSLAIFMEIHVLLSLVVGYFLFRAQFYVGEVRGWVVDPQYPYVAEQQCGAYLVYGFIILFLARRYLGQTLKCAVAGRNETDEVISPRSALLLLACCFLALCMWAKWVGFPISGMLILFSALLLFSLVAIRIRTECGSPGNAYFPGGVVGVVGGCVVLVPYTGGLDLFTPSGVVFATMLSLVLGGSSFLIIPGLQFELIEIGRRLRIRPSHVVLCGAIGAVGGLAIGGWSYLYTSYAVGIEEFGSRTIMGSRHSDFAVLNELVATSEDRFFEAGNEAGVQTSSTGPNPGHLAFGYAGGGTLIASIFRQIYSGFWFHPVGFILGPTRVMNSVWGSLLMACLVRFLVLRIGGALWVRERLIPFAFGAFLASVLVQAFLLVVNGWVSLRHPGSATFEGLL